MNQHMPWKYHVAPYLFVSVALSLVLYFTTSIILLRSIPQFIRTPEQIRFDSFAIVGAFAIAWATYPIIVLFYSFFRHDLWRRDGRVG
jgi:hypothetical protein